MNWKWHLRKLLNEHAFNRFFYYYLHIKGRAIPRRLNLRNPTTFNEKTIWLKMNQRYPLAGVYADKVRVKDFVREVAGDKYVIPTLAVHDAVNDIDFTALPEAFVLKANHGSGWNIICPDKTKLDADGARRRLRGWLRMNYFDVGKEYQYRNIQPKILVESYLEDTAADPLIDYKIFCFSGEPLFIQIDADRHTNHTRNFYDLEWNLMPFTTCYPLGTKKLARPSALDEMLALAQKLAKGLVFARIDLYYHRDRVFFGEITLHHGGGFEPFFPREYDLALGQYICLPDRA